MKLMGFVPYKSPKVGKVLFVIEENPTASTVVGYTTDKIFVNGELSVPIDAKWIGKEIDISYTADSQGRAFVKDVRLIG